MAELKEMQSVKIVNLAGVLYDVRNDEALLKKDDVIMATPLPDEKPVLI